MHELDPFVSLKELRAQFPKYIAAAGRGKSFTVIKRSRPVFRITPIDSEDAWEAVVDFTTIKKGGVDVHELLERIETIKQP